jgi:metal-responsive CopG/Arc/MetJ family transcriptional regulator
MKIEINEELGKSFDKYASILGSSRDEIIKEALIEKLENLEDIRIAKERLANPAKTYSMEEVEIELED